MTQSKPNYGGQALIEGIMFVGKSTTISAVRRSDNSIEYHQIPKPENPFLNRMKKIPFIRGIAGLFDSLGAGTAHLNYSADVYEDDRLTEAEKREKAEKAANPQKKNWTMLLGVTLVGILTFLFAKLVFTLVPVLIASLFSEYISSRIGQVLLESLFKFILLLGYLYAISFTPLVKRVFQYHGAEHKVINTYEHDLPLTVPNVRSQSRLHYRCGSSFILFTVFVGLFVYLFFPTDPLWLRIIIRILLIPVVLGISYEVLQLTNRLQNIKILNWAALPGLYLQKLTTKEPTDDQIEVAIASFNKLLSVEKEGGTSSVNA